MKLYFVTGLICLTMVFSPLVPVANAGGKATTVGFFTKIKNPWFYMHAWKKYPTYFDQIEQLLLVSAIEQEEATRRAEVAKQKKEAKTQTKNLNYYLIQKQIIICGKTSQCLNRNPLRL